MIRVWYFLGTRLVRLYCSRILGAVLVLGFLGFAVKQLNDPSIKVKDLSMVGFKGDNLILLKNLHGVELHILTLGAVVQKLLVPDKNGVLGDVALGFDTLDPYLDGTSPYFGAVVGRVANRVQDAHFVLDGKSYNLSANDPPNSLHGGTWGWSRKSWSIAKRETFDDGGCSVRLEYKSAAMEEGYPGAVVASVTYSLDSKATIKIEFSATSDAATPINMAQHTYFNLDGVDTARDILQHSIQINSSYVTPVDETRIPTGAFEAVPGTPFDFLTASKIGARLSTVPGPPPVGYDINYVLWGLDESSALQSTHNCTALQEPAVAVTVTSKSSGRKLEVLTTSPGLQFYSGNQLDGTLEGKNGVKYLQYGGFALETQMFPNSVNQPKFPQCVLRPGEQYSTNVIWKFSVE